MRVTPILRHEEPLHPPYPFVTSRNISTALLTCYISTCCNIKTLVFVSLRVLKFRFLGVIFGGAVLRIYYANEFSILPLFLSFFDSFLYSLFRYLLCHVTTLPHYHVNELPYYLQLQLEVSQTCHIVLRLKICHVVCALCVVLSCFAVEDLQLLGRLVRIHQQPRQLVVNTFKLTR